MKRIFVDNSENTERTSKKRRRVENDRDLKGFIVTDSESDDEKNDPPFNPKLQKKLKLIDDEINRRDITEEDILKLNLSLDDNVWFIEHIRMLDAMDDDTEDKYALKNKIYNRYKQVTSSSYNILKTTYGLDHDPDENMIGKIFSSKHSDHVKSLMFTRFVRASEKGSSDEYFKAAEWVDYVLRIPTEVKMDLDNVNINDKLTKFWTSVNKRVYGLYNVKEKLLEALNTYLMSRGTIGRVITLVGPPGVGKTSIAEALAEAMELSFNQISMSDVTDPSVLVGHSSTYIGSHPGVIVEILRKTNRLDNLILLDEIDKTRTNQSDGQNLSTVLLKILDKMQNKKFNDAYMPEIDIDLSKTIFIATANNEDNIPTALSDRLYKIYISGYDTDDKVNIGKDYMVPSILAKLGLNEKHITIDTDNMKYLVHRLTDTPGVRNLERAIEELFDRLLLMTNIGHTNIPLSYKIPKVKLPIRITKQHIDNLVTQN